MPEFLELVTPPQAWDRWIAALRPRLPLDRIDVVDSLGAIGRVLAGDVIAPESLPAFRRSTVDGYAVRATDTHGATPSLPALLRLAGEVPMGAAPDLDLGPQQAAIVHTGGMLPGGSDAVVMLEDCERSRAGEVAVRRAAAVGEHVLQVGEDLSAGSPALEAGTLLRAADIGGLMALGITEIEVRAKPRVGLISSGDEVVSPDRAVGPGQVRDVNSSMLAALVVKGGGDSGRFGIAPDDRAALLASARDAMAASDVVVISAGSSASVRDITAEVMAELGAPGVLVHGVAIKPGKPTILACCDGVPVLGLPGNPVSAYVVARLFLSPLMGRMLGRIESPLPGVRASFSTRWASQAGREDYVPVRLLAQADGLSAEPVYGRSNLIFTLSRADGWVRIPAEATGLEAGDPVEVTLLV
jgi:molybdopterin molybdotransferase